MRDLMRLLMRYTASMEKKTLSLKRVRKLSKVASGASYSITLPIEFVRELGWKERQKLDVELVGKKIVIKDWKK